MRWTSRRPGLVEQRPLRQRSDWSKIDSRDFQNIALDSSGTAWEWGGLDDQQQPRPTMTAVTGVPAFSEVQEREHACGLSSSDGSLWCWNGAPRSDGTNGNVTTPTRMGRSTDRWTAFDVAQYATCAIASGTGKVECWGWNRAGELGIGGYSSSYEPFPIANSGAFREVTGGDESICALSTGGALWCWGQFAPTTTPAPTYLGYDVPMACDSGTAFTHIDVGSYGCGVRSDSTIACWGSTNPHGELGVAGPAAKSDFVQVPGDHWSKVTVGLDHACALHDDGSLYCWGATMQLPLGSNERPVPVPLHLP